MRIAVLGTGVVGTTLGDALIARDHEVWLGSRSGDNETARAWSARQGERAHHAAFAAAAAAADLVVNATAGVASLAALDQVGQELLAGKVLLDVANPLDFTHGFPPTLSVCNDDSLGEQIQRRFPDTRVVKALNTVAASVMVDPQQLAGASDVFLAGDDDSAKEAVAEILGGFGWPREHIRDLGGITAARGLEMYLALWVRLMAQVDTAVFNVRVVTADA